MVISTLRLDSGRRTSTWMTPPAPPPSLGLETLTSCLYDSSTSCHFTSFVDTGNPSTPLVTPSTSQPAECREATVLYRTCVLWKTLGLASGTSIVVITHRPRTARSCQRRGPVEKQLSNPDS